MEVNIELSNSQRQAYFFNVHSSSDHFYIVQGKLGALSDNFTIDDNHGTAIVVESVAVTALLVGIEINASALNITSSVLVLSINRKNYYQFGGLGDEVQPCVKLAELVMAARRVGDDLDTFSRGRSDKSIQLDVKIPTCQSVGNMRSLNVSAYDQSDKVCCHEDC